MGLLYEADLESAVKFFLEFLKGFEIITLMQTGKLDAFPVVAMGSEFWNKLRKFVKGTMITEETISPEDLELLHPAKTVEEAVSYIESTGG